MCVTQVLKRIREIIDDYDFGMVVDIEELIVLIDELDKWLSDGHSLPNQWEV